MSNSNSKDTSHTIFLGPNTNREVRFNSIKEIEFRENEDENNSNPQPKHSLSDPPKNNDGTVFLGPNSSREMKVEAIIRSQNSTWDDDTHAKYMENIRKKAASKVKAMLLQAQKRSNEIIKEAEEQASGLQDRLQTEIKTAEELAQKAKLEYENSYNKAIQDANQKANEQIANERKMLGESTAVVLLSIHQQLQGIYDSWKEELKLLTIEAINVGTGWILDSQKEEIIKSMLNNCVKKLTEKKDFVVRVHPSDGDLVTQVLENSREKSWNVEVSNDLEPGSLELENLQSFIKNSSQERRDFVQDILNSLVLPSKGEEANAIQNVSNSLMNEMQENPLLASAAAQFESAEDQNNMQAQDMATSQEMTQAQSQNIPDQAPIMPEIPAQNPAPFGTNLEQIQENNIPSQAENPAPELEMANPKPQKASPPQPKVETPPMINPQEESEHLVDSFLSDLESGLPPANNSIDNIPDHSLPDNLANDLLAEMGFDDEKK